MNVIIILLYSAAGINALAIFYLLYRAYKAGHGLLVKYLYLFFGALLLALSVRLLSGVFGWEYKTTTVVIMIPINISLALLARYLYKLKK